MTTQRARCGRNVASRSARPDSTCCSRCVADQ
jgi:hypothetical protein